MHTPRLRNTFAAASALAVAVAATPGGVHGDGAPPGAVTATADDAISVDVRSGVAAAIAPAAISYDPAWCGAGENGAYVTIERVSGLASGSPSTNTLATLPADATGDYAYSPAAGDERCVRLIHRVHAAGGAEIGDPLVRDVAFGWRGVASADAVADTRASSLAEAVAAQQRGGASVALAYDTAWATNGAPASVAVSALRLAGEGGAVTETVPLLSASADAAGTAPLRGVNAGWARLVCRIADAGGATLLEYTTGDFLLKEFATVILMK